MEHTLDQQQSQPPSYTLQIILIVPYRGRPTFQTPQTHNPLIALNKKNIKDTIFNCGRRNPDHTCCKKRNYSFVIIEGWFRGFTKYNVKKKRKERENKTIELFPLVKGTQPSLMEHSTPGDVPSPAKLCTFSKDFKAHSSFIHKLLLGERAAGKAKRDEKAFTHTTHTHLSVLNSQWLHSWDPYLKLVE